MFSRGIDCLGIGKKLNFRQDIQLWETPQTRYKGPAPPGESSLSFMSPEESFHFYDFIACFIQLAAGRVFVNNVNSSPSYLWKQERKETVLITIEM